MTTRYALPYGCTVESVTHMDWRREPSDDANDPTGVTALLERAQNELGGDPITGTRFLHDATEMLRATREIEAAVSGVDTTLYVGFQNAEKLDGEADVYRALTKGGTSVQAFGEGTSQEARRLDRVTWTALPQQRYALENQWFLVTRDPEPIAFVGFEASPEDQRGHGDATDPRKSWEGFVTDDERVIDAIIAHLDSVVRQHRDS